MLLCCMFKVWFVGNETSFHIPTLISGAHYTFRVSARLIPFDGPGLKIWSAPSNTVEFCEKTSSPPFIPPIQKGFTKSATIIIRNRFLLIFLKFW